MTELELGANTVLSFGGGVTLCDDPAGPYGGNSSGTSFTVLQPISRGGFGGVIAAVACYAAGYGYANLTRSCTIGGVPMTLVGAVDNNNSPGSGWCELYFYSGFIPPGSYDVVYSVSSPGAYISIITNPYNGVGAVSAPTINVGDSAAATTGAITSATGEIVVAAMSSPVNTYWDNANQTDNWIISGAAQANYCQVMLEDGPGASSVTVTGATNVAGAWGVVAARLQQLDYSVSDVPVPAGIQGCWVTLIGCGGAGSGGSVGGSTATSGSGGAGGAAIFSRYVPASALGSSYDVTIPPSPLGGAGAYSGAGASGGATADNVIFTSGPTTLQVSSGGPGTNTSTSTSGGNGAIVGDYIGGAGGTGSLSGTPFAGSDAGANVFAGAGGGGGGRSPAGSAAGGSSLSFGLAGGAGGTSTSPAGAGGPPPVGFVPGAGGGGGWGADANGVLAGGVGGDGTGYGAGGGGGGSGGKSAAGALTAGGNGGAGGPGFCGIVWDYK